jgi:hypothetical protein
LPAISRTFRGDADEKGFKVENGPLIKEVPRSIPR